MNVPFLLPPRLFNENGDKRRVGFELEFGGVDLFETAQIIQSLFGGEIEKKGDYSYRVKTDDGEFVVEADTLFLLEDKPGKMLKQVGLDPQTSTLGQNVEDAITSIAEAISPFEIASPPFPMDRLDLIEDVRYQLYLHSAKGTNAGILKAFGMQFNPELPDRNVATILSFLRAFFFVV